MSVAAVLVVFVLLVGGCWSTPAPVEEPAASDGPAAAPPPPEPLVPQEPPPPPPTEPGPPEPAPKPEFSVTTEVYNRTFDEIRAVIDELNRHIAGGEYEGWLEHLTQNYVRETSRPEFLDKWRDDPELKQRGIVLRTLKDFFVYRVVPTRTTAKLDEIEFVDDEHVYAFTVLRGEKYLLYSLVKTAEGWKVDFY
jgi:hypothetical protein